MTRLAAALVAATTFLSLFSATAAEPTPGSVLYKTEKRTVAAQDHPYLTRRQTVSAGLSNEISFYVINVTVGTPPQPFSLQLDTGSSDLWFPTSDSNGCQNHPDLCSAAGSYNPDASTTFTQPELPAFQIAYVDGTQVEGAYIQDVLRIGSTTIQNMTMAAATQVESPLGIMGIAYSSGEAEAPDEIGMNGFQYPNINDVLLAQGFTNARSYSLWLDDLTANTGNILFGGVDTSKFHGDLIALPVQIDTSTNNFTSFTVAWTGLTLNSAGKTHDMSPSSAQPAILDSGTSLTLVPDDIATNIFQAVGVVTDPSSGNFVACSLAQDDLTFSFTFGGKSGPSVTVPASEFVIDPELEGSQRPTFPDGTQACQFGIEAAAGRPILFGDTFLRSAYVVYDLDNNEIALANTNFNAGSANVKAFSQSGGIPGVSSTASGVTVAQTATGNPQITAQSTGAVASGQLSGTNSPTIALTVGSATSAPSSTGGGSGSSSSSSSSAANSHLKASPITGAGVMVGGVLVASLLFGGGLVML